MRGKERISRPVDGSSEISIAWACPVCRDALQGRGPLRCAGCRVSYLEVDGIREFLAPNRRQALSHFIREYEAIRRAEGRHLLPAEYRALPFLAPPTSRHQEWKIRAATFRTLRSALQRWQGVRREPLRVCDLGAGNCWLSNRLALAGLEVVAVDFIKNRFDGLGCHCHYRSSFTCVEAEFDRLPFQDRQFDVAIFNASLHYSAELETTLRESLRVLQPAGRIVVLDSPLYRERASGEQMVRQREQSFRETYGFASDRLESEHFLTFRRLEELAAALDVTWSSTRPAYGLRWRLRQWKESLLGSREPATFLMLVATRRGC